VRRRILWATLGVTLAVIAVMTVAMVRTTGQMSWLGALLLAALLTAAATAVALQTSRRLTRPLSELVEDAERLGSGDLRPSGRRSGIAELDQLADSLEIASSRVAELLAEERSLTQDVSHQLKTPLTALSLRLEELAAWPDDPDVRAEAAAAFEQVERLSNLVDVLLSERRWSAAQAQQAPLRAVIDQQLSEWRPAYDATRRQLRAEIDDEVALSVNRGPVGQVVASLVENSLVHGDGATTVEVRSRAGVTWIEVSDEGPGIPDHLASHVFDRDVSGGGSTGLGLAGAQDAAASVGGRITLVGRRPARFRFFLDGREHPTPVGPEPEQGAERDPDDIGRDVVGER
jgi:signal transduction histidine kinase